MEKLQRSRGENEHKGEMREIIFFGGRGRREETDTNDRAKTEEHSGRLEVRTVGMTKKKKKSERNEGSDEDASADRRCAEAPMSGVVRRGRDKG